MKELIQDIKNGTFRKVYLLYGDEDYLKLMWRDRLVKALIPDENSMNLSMFSGNRVSETEIIDLGDTLPFFADRRVIRLDETGFFSSSTERLPDYVKELPDHLCLVFTESDVDKRNRLFKAVQKYGHCAEFGEQPEKVLESWVLKILDGSGLKIRPSTMEMLLNRTGTDMTHIAMETDKLVHYCAGREEITPEDVRAVIPDRMENRIFDMISALTENRKSDAMALYSDLLALKEPPMRILFLISQQYSRLLMIRELDASGAGQTQIASAAGMPPFAVKKNLKLARSFSPEKLRGLLELCTQLEEDVKNGRIADRIAVELAMLS